MGHRLTILKGVYDIKIKQDIPMDSDHYIPLCKETTEPCWCTLADTFKAAEASVQDQTATQDDIARIIQSIKMRDERIVQAESELRRVTDEYRKLREELLPVFRMAKDRSQPLPFQPSASGYSPDYHNHNEGLTSPVTSQAPLEKGSGNTSRKFPTQKLFLGSTPKTNSPTHIPHSIPEGKPLSDTTTLDPSAAVTLASNHLAAQTINGIPPASSPNQINLPSPTSPSIYNNQQPLPPHIYSRPNGNSQPSARPVYAHPTDDSHSSLAPTLVGLERDRSNPTPTPTGSNRQPRQPDELPPPYSSAQKEPPSVDIVKKFRVSVDDPCYKVLPAALKKYNINAPWRQYSLYIVYGDQERCLGLDEKPLELFKQLNLEGRKPMFMLRRHATPTEGHSGPSATGGTGSAGFDPATGLSALRGHQSSIQLTQLPGGVL